MSIRSKYLITCGVISLITAGAVIGFFLFKRPMNAEYRDSFYVEVFALVLGLVMLSVSIGYLVVQPIRRRLYDIEEAAALIASGRLQHRVETMGDTDEIGQLAAQFNVMGDKIQAQVALLQQMAEQNRSLQVDAERAAALEERQRLARDLHDTVSQQLFAITMLAATAVRHHEQQSVHLEKTLTQLAEISNAAQREMRALLLHLRPLNLEGRSFYEAALDFLRAIEERYHLRCEISVDDNTDLPPSIEDELFRILQEAMANVLKHADATQVKVELREEAKQIIRLSVLDDGIGIDERLTGDKGLSYGLNTMKERAARLGGECRIWKREQGTAVEIRIPIVEVDA
jgi:two-component system, NarL family, sensor histidine kinase LiaS